jgi:hypothetical protein
MNTKHPLAEVFGFTTTDMSAIAWMIYDLKPPAIDGEHYELSRERIVYTQRPIANDLELKKAEPIENFEQRILCGMDEAVV